MGRTDYTVKLRIGVEWFAALYYITIYLCPYPKNGATVYVSMHTIAKIRIWEVLELEVLEVSDDLTNDKISWLISVCPIGRIPVEKVKVT